MKKKYHFIRPGCYIPVSYETAEKKIHREGETGFGINVRPKKTKTGDDRAKQGGKG
jgi:hypothetical protein